MVLILVMTLALGIGYVSVVMSYFLLSFALTSSAPHFVSDAGRFRPSYLLVNCFVWMLCTILGSYVTASISIAWFPWLPVAVLGVSLVLLTWHHPLEAHWQLAGLARVLMSGVSAVGVTLGYFLRFRL